MSKTYSLGNRDFTGMECGQCGIEFYVPSSFHREQRQLGPRGGWYCPNGHIRVFSKSETDELRAERDRLKQEQAWYEDRLRVERENRERAERKASAARGQVTKLKKRAAAGVCPCCNRTFQNLHNHMAKQHPGFVNEPDATAHVN